MRLLETLRDDHDVLEQVLSALCAYADRRAEGAADPADAWSFVEFFRVYGGRHHHAAEEDVLFPALVQHAELPGHRGPLRALGEQHVAMASLLDPLVPALRGGGPAAPLLARRYAHQLWQHIDAENSVLLPAARERLVRAGIHELPVSPMSREAGLALDDARRLLAAYPAAPDPSAWRGEGCIVCPSYGLGCDGLEREWWNESEWDEFADHLGSD